MKPILFFIRKLLKGLGVAILLAGLLLAVLLSPWGLGQVTPAVESRFSEALGRRVVLDGLTLHWPLELRLAGGAIRAPDAGGEGAVLLAWRGVVLRVSLRQLLGGRLWVHQLRLESLEVRGWAAGEPVEKRSPGRWSAPGALEGVLARVRVEALLVDRLRLGAMAEETYGVKGSLVEAQLEAGVRRLGRLTSAGEVAEAEVFRLKAGLAGGRLALRARLDGLSMAGLRLPAGVGDGARLAGHLEVTGALAAPAGRAQLEVTGLRPGGAQPWDGAPLRIEVQATLEGERLRLGGRMEGLPGEPLVVALDVPMRLSLHPWSLDWPAEEPMTGQVTQKSDLGGWARLLVLDVYHRLVGVLDIDLRLTGTPAAPELQGHLRLLDGSYEHALYGLMLRRLEVSISAGREGLVIDHVRASDGGRGRLEGSGVWRFSPREGHPFDARLSLRDFRLMKNDMADVTGRGTLRWQGTPSDSLLSGNLQLGPVEARVPARRSALLTPLEVVEFDAVEVAGAAKVREAGAGVGASPAPPTRFDVAILAERCFLRGRGLDSEWKAKVRVQGDAGAPRLVGAMEVLRGRFMFYGRRLRITDGVVRLDGAWPPAPVVDVGAELGMRDMTAMLRVTGAFKNPTIVLDANPALPEDEILARLLFGRDAARINPWQAVTLARAVKQLRGGGTAFDLMGETRRRMGVDQLEVSSSDPVADLGALRADNAALRVGKYVHDRLYVEVERGLVAEGGGQAAVEMELTPRLSLETQTGVNAGAGVGLVWSWDY